jgi:hypothetical protein
MTALLPRSSRTVTLLVKHASHALSRYLDASRVARRIQHETGIGSAHDLRPAADDFRDHAKALSELSFEPEEIISLVAEWVMSSRSSIDEIGVPVRPEMHELQSTIRKLMAPG